MLLLFFVFFGLLGLFVVGGIGALAFLETRLLGGSGHTAALVWTAGVGLVFALPMIAMAMGMRAFRSFAVPLAGLMAAADAVARGDLTARVRDEQRGPFGGVARSFNRMLGELQRTDQLRKNLTADIAHELRTPLHVIQGNLEGILDDVYQPTREHIDATLEEAGQLQLRRESVAVGDFLVDVASAYGGQAEAAGIHLRTDIPNAPPDVPLAMHADAGRMQQVFGNLLSNALRHTPSGGTITLAAQRSAQGVRLSVADTGEGIPTEDIPYIFERFWRGDKVRQKPGTGLGLAIARQLVLAHAGSIEVASEMGKGTTFRVELPAGPDEPHSRPP